MTALTIEKIHVHCEHCGDLCGQEKVVWHSHYFCCQGCQTVYELLHENELNTYYQLESKPGINRKHLPGSQKYTYLAHPDIMAPLFDFQDTHLAKITLFIPAIHCSSCIWLLENLHRLHEGILHAHVDFPKKKVSITFQMEQLTLRALVELLSTLGYEPEINLATKAIQKTRTDTGLILKIGIAGFCFGNTMLLSLPEYLDAQALISPEYKQFFGYLNLLLAVPVFFYSASDYFMSAWKGLRQRFFNIDVPIALGIIVLFTRSVFEIISGTGAGYIDSLTGLVFFLLIGKWYQSKTYQALSYDRDYQSYFPVAVTVIDRGEEKSVPLQQVQVGDQLLVRHQEIIPADAILLEGDALIDYSFVTGESVPMKKDANDLVYAGGRQIGSSMQIEVQKPVSNSYLTQLWNQEVFRKEPDSKVSSLVNAVSKYFTWGILALSMVTAVFWFFTDSTLIMKTVTSVLIVACPCALALAAPFTFGHTIRLFGKFGLYLKNAEAIEKMAKADQLVFDKTGTITHTNTHYAVFVGKRLTDYEACLLASVVRNSLHPLSQIIYRTLPVNSATYHPENFNEVPGQGICALVDGKEVQLGSDVFVLGEKQGEPGSTKVYVKIDGMVKGYYSLENTYRTHFPQVMRILRKDYKTHLLSGDNDREKEKLTPYFSELHFDQSPVDKLQYLQHLEEQGAYPAMIGDGLNDAGALKQSKLGIAIADQVYHFSPACDAILHAIQFSRLPTYLQFSKTSMRIVKTAFGLSFLYNLVGLSFAVSGLLTPLVAAILMPLSSVSIVGFITLAVNIKARSLFKKPDKNQFFS